MKSLVVFCLALFVFSFARAQGTANSISHGRIVSIKDYQSKFVLPRNVDIWLPEDYDQSSTERYAVLYMQDGQNLFSSGSSYGGVEWQVDETLSRLRMHDSVRKVIVVGIWNSAKRFLEYNPAKAYKLLRPAIQKELETEYGGKPLSDEYLKFMVKELKPYIDAHFRTKKDRANTYVAGSSMGGLISLYALFEYPTIFGGAACISTHWPVSIKRNGPEAPKALLNYIRTHLPQQECRLYFDHGTATLDSWYTPYQGMVDVLLKQRAPKTLHWISKVYNGAEHNEASWQKRFDTVAYFLMPPVK
jgi:predicted alpha/beta superfamily hydrolase